MSRAKELFERVMRDKETAIDWFLDERETEKLFLDFKQSANSGDTKHLDNNDKRNYGKAVSGFGNSEGGIIVWGVDCRPNKDGTDAAIKKCPITNPRRFAANLDNLTKGRTIPPHNLVENEFFEVGSDGTGYVISFIPQCDYAPLQTVDSKDFFVRIGSSFDKATYAYLASQFGRRPEPKIELVFKESNRNLSSQKEIFIEGIFEVRNSGVAVERDVYFTFIIQSKPGGLCTVSPSPMGDRWITNSEPDEVSMVSKDGIRLPPLSSWPAFRLAIRVSPAIERELRVKLYCGCLNSPVQCFTWHKPKKFFEQMVDDLLPKIDQFGLRPEQFAAHRKAVQRQLAEYSDELFAMLPLPSERP